MSAIAPIADIVGGATIGSVAYEAGTDYERVGRVAYYGFFVAMLSVVLYISTRPSVPDPPNSKAYGCYITANAAPIILSKQGMAISQPWAIYIDFHLEHTKTGIALVADAPIAAEPTGQRYTYSIEPPGVGWYLDFFNVIGGQSYGVSDENQLRQFTMLARDGAHLTYRKAARAACRI